MSKSSDSYLKEKATTVIDILAPDDQDTVKAYIEYRSQVAVDEYLSNRNSNYFGAILLGVFLLGIVGLIFIPMAILRSDNDVAWKEYAEQQDANMVQERKAMVYHQSRYSMCQNELELQKKKYDLEIKGIE